MSLARASGFRNIGASTMSYIPVVYAAKLITKFYDACVLAAISNTDYQGEIKNMGDSVIIRGVPDMTIRDWQVGGTLTIDQPTATPTTLNIDHAKVWAFIMDKIDQKQTDIKSAAEKWATDASEQMKIAIDTDVLADIYADVNAYNKGATAGIKTGNIDLGADGGTSISLTKTNILEKLTDCMQVLDEQSVPETGRFIVLPPWACGLIMKSDLKDASLAGDGTSIMRNGRLGMIAGFEIFKSNLLATSNDGVAAACHHCLFGVKIATTFASQLVENEVTDNTYGFGKIYKGLQVYGKKVVVPKALGDLYCKKG